MDPDSASPALRTLTGTTLLEGLRDPANATLWQQYVDRYRPLILEFGRRAGLGDADAEDAAQAALVAFSAAYARGAYDRDRGRLSSWLFAIVHNQIQNLRRREGTRSGRHASTGAEGLEELAGEDELEALWNEEWRNAVLQRCLEEARAEVRPETWRAFELFALGDFSANEAAERLGTTREKVFGAKRRILRRVRELRPLMEDTL